jgi:hypothetical protein
VAAQLAASQEGLSSVSECLEHTNSSIKVSLYFSNYVSSFLNHIKYGKSHQFAVFILFVLSIVPHTRVSLDIDLFYCLPYGQFNMNNILTNDHM